MNTYTRKLYSFQQSLQTIEKAFVRKNVSHLSTEDEIIILILFACPKALLLLVLFMTPKGLQDNGNQFHCALTSLGMAHKHFGVSRENGTPDLETRLLEMNITPSKCQYLAGSQTSPQHERNKCMFRVTIGCL